MRWLRDPLVLFLLLGGGLACLHLALREEAPPIRRDAEIVVTDADVMWLAQVFQKTWQRAPSRAELRSLVDRRVRDEMLYREARALGLDEGDDALRRRLAMKLEFLAEDVGAAAEPTEAEIEAWFREHPSEYARRGFRTFVHVFVSPDKRKTAAEADAEALLERLRADPALDPGTLGDRILLEPEYRYASPRDVTALFGASFADALFAQEVGRWVGPLRSGYGLHLVLVKEDVPGGTPPLAEVRTRVRSDLVEARKAQALERYLDALRARYTVELRTSLLDDEGA